MIGASEISKLGNMFL